MVAKKKQKGTKKLKLKKETILDLDAKDSGRQVKAGMKVATGSCKGGCTFSCNMWCG